LTFFKIFNSNNIECFLLLNSIFPLIKYQDQHNTFDNIANKNQILILNKKNNLVGLGWSKTYQPSYLAGLIEGDGSIYVPDNLRNDKGQLIQANIEIIFTINDLSLANLIIKKIGGGYLIKNDNYARLFIKNKSSLLQLINLINSYP
jgi:LAGLIDADG endonuclease